MADHDRAGERRLDFIAVLVVVLAMGAGAAARLGTVDWGLPHALHVDEKAFVIWPALEMEWEGLRNDDWRPRTNTYGPLVFELVVGVKWWLMGGREHAERVASRYRGSWDYVRGGFDSLGMAPFHMPQLVLLVRWMAAILGILAIGLLAAAAWALEGRRAGAFTAILAAVSVGLIQVGHFYTPESLLVFEIAMFLCACALLARGRGLAVAAWAGLCLGLIAATKMYGLVIAAALPLAIAANDPFPDAASRERELGRMLRRSVRALCGARMLVAVGVALVVYRVLCPWAFTESDLYFADGPATRDGFNQLLVHYRETEFDFYDWRFTYNSTTPFVYQLTAVLPYAIGGLTTIAAVIALLVGVRRLSATDRIGLAAALPILLLVGPWGVKTIRYVIPMVPALLLLTGSMLARWSLARARGQPWHRRLGRRAAAALVLAWTAAYGLAFTLMFLSPDPRLSAARWIADHARPGDVVVVDREGAYTAPLGDDQDGVGVNPRVRPAVTIHRLWWGSPPQAEVGAHLEGALSNARFLVVGDFYERRGLSADAAEKAPAQHAFYTDLREGRTGFVRVRSFRPVPALGPVRWPEEEAEILSVCFDHMGIDIYERRAPLGNPVEGGDVEAPE